MLESFRQFAENNVHILITDTEVTNAPQGKEVLFAAVRHAADVVVTLDTTEGRYALIVNGAPSSTERQRDSDSFALVTIPPRSAHSS